jgi:tRNA G26 N,N-dimethylase Trm1
MRQIHPTTLREKFLASGLYQHYRNEELTGLVEHWTIHELSNSAWMIRVDWDARDDKAINQSMLLEALCLPATNGMKIERIDIDAYGTHDDPIKFVKASYIFFDHHVQINRTLDGETMPLEDIDLPPNYAINVGTRLLIGWMIAQVASNKGVPFPVFSIETSHHARTAFAGYMTEESALLVDEDWFVTPTNKRVRAKHYNWLKPSDVQQIESTLWLDEYNILLLHDSFSLGDVMLNQYARRPEPTQS